MINTLDRWGVKLLELGEELAVTDKLLKARNETLALIPECPIHGPQCQPHMREWIEKAKALEAAVHSLYGDGT